MPTYRVVFDPPTVPALVLEGQDVESLADPIMRHAQEHLSDHLDGVAIGTSFLDPTSGGGHVLAHPDEPASFRISQES